MLIDFLKMRQEYLSLAEVAIRNPMQHLIHDSKPPRQLEENFLEITLRQYGESRMKFRIWIAMDKIMHEMAPLINE